MNCSVSLETDIWVERKKKEKEEFNLISPLFLGKKLFQTNNQN